MRAGQLRHRLQFQRMGEATDRFGQIKTDFVDLFATRGNVRESTGKERVEAGSVENYRTATMRVRGNSNTRSLTEADRVVARGESWRIIGIANADDKGSMLDILCEAFG